MLSFGECGACPVRRRVFVGRRACLDIVTGSRLGDPMSECGQKESTYQLRVFRRHCKRRGLEAAWQQAIPGAC